MSVPTNGASSHTPRTPTLGSMPRPRASHFCYIPAVDSPASRMGRADYDDTRAFPNISTTNTSSEEIALLRESKRATTFLDRSITGFSLQIDQLRARWLVRFPCKSCQIIDISFEICVNVFQLIHNCNMRPLKLDDDGVNYHDDDDDDDDEDNNDNDVKMKKMVLMIMMIMLR